jgi:hypothetical protein
MKNLLDKLSSYDIFNHLLPGVLLAVFVDALTLLKILQKDIVVGFFVYYFLGSVVSRIGSLLVEAILRKFNVVRSTHSHLLLHAYRASTRIRSYCGAWSIRVAGGFIFCRIRYHCAYLYDKREFI